MNNQNNLESFAKLNEWLVAGTDRVMIAKRPNLNIMLVDIVDSSRFKTIPTQKNTGFNKMRSQTRSMRNHLFCWDCFYLTSSTKPDHSLAFTFNSRRINRRHIRLFVSANRITVNLKKSWIQTLSFDVNIIKSQLRERDNNAVPIFAQHFLTNNLINFSRCNTSGDQRPSNIKTSRL